MTVRNLATLLAVLALCSISSGTPPRSPRDYYEELRTSHGLPRWGVNVCFADDDDIRWFLLVGEDRQITQIRWYVDGVGGDVWPFDRLTGDETDSEWQAKGQRNGKAVLVTFRLNWKTGRFALEEETQRTHKVFRIGGLCGPVD